MYDGGISEFNLKKLSSPSNEVVSGLWMPHSVKYFDNNITFLNSMKGELRNEIHKVMRPISRLCSRVGL